MRRAVCFNQELDWKKEKVAHVLNCLEPTERSAEVRKASADLLIVVGADERDYKLPDG